MRSAILIRNRRTSLRSGAWENLSRTCERLVSLRHTVATQRSWVSGSGQVGLLGFSNEPDDVDLLHVSPPNSPVRSMSCGEPASRIMTCVLHGGIRARLHEQLTDAPGATALFVADGASDEIAACNTLARLEPVYFAEGSEYDVIGTWALIVHLLAMGLDTLRYDLNAVAALINAGYCTIDETPFRGMKVLAPASTVRFDGGGPRICRTELADIFGVNETPGAGDFDRIAEAFVSACAPLCGTERPVTIGLTGGKDSRLMLAGLKAAGVNVAAYTFGRGDANRADVEIARLVAEAAGVPHEVREAAPDAGRERTISVDLQRRAAAAIRVSDGQVSCYEALTLANTYVCHPAAFGVAGELLRGGFAKVVSAPTIGQARNWILNHATNCRGLMRREAHERLQSHVLDWIERHANRLGPPDLLEAFYLSFRCGRWTACCTRAALIANPVHYVLARNSLLIPILRFPTELRSSERTIYELMRRLLPAACTLPFANDYWKFQAAGERARLRDEWPDAFVRPGERAGAVNTDWRRLFGTQLREEFAEQILHDPTADGLFELLDRDKIEKLFASASFARPENRMLAFGAYTAAVLLSNKWMTSPMPSRPREVRFEATAIATTTAPPGVNVPAIARDTQMTRAAANARPAPARAHALEARVQVDSSSVPLNSLLGKRSGIAALRFGAGALLFGSLALAFRDADLWRRVALIMAVVASAGAGGFSLRALWRSRTLSWWSFGRRAAMAAFGFMLISILLLSLAGRDAAPAPP